MRKLLIAVGLVGLAWATTIFADEPPDELMYHVMQQRVVHDELCTIAGMENVECLVFVEGAVLWVVIFDDDLAVTHIMSVEDDTLSIHWSRADRNT